MASTYLARACDATSAGGYSNKWTWSGWVKRAKLDVNEGIICNKRGDNNTNSRFRLFFKSNNKLAWECKDSGGSDDNSFETNMLFRDIFAWYHIVFIYDSDNSTETDRMKCYVNGKDLRTELGGFSSINEVGSGFGTLWSSAVSNYLGTMGPNITDSEFDGCMSHCHLTYGHRYEASTFGSFDSTTGEWKINTNPSVTYGSQGYFLLKDNASVTDQSGEGNNYTATGTLTKTEDCPSNVFCVINPLDSKIAFSLANGNTTLNDNGSDDNDNGIRANMGVNSGKYYWEMKKGSGSGGVHAVVTEDVDVRLGNRATSSPDSNLWGFQSNGTGAPLVSYIAGTFDSSGNALQGWGANDIIGFALDMDNGKLYLSVNGVFKGLDNNTSNPVTQTNPAISGIPTGGKFVFPYFEKRSADSPETMCNFGNGYFGTTAISSEGTNASNIGKFEFDVPTGFTALCTKGINI